MSYLDIFLLIFFIDGFSDFNACFIGLKLDLHELIEKIAIKMMINLFIFKNYDFFSIKNN